MTHTAGSFTCPTCHRTSHHPRDVEQGYCGACHWWTSNRGLPTQPSTLDAADPCGDTLRWVGHLRDIRSSLGETSPLLPTDEDHWAAAFVHDWNQRRAAQAAAACAALTYTRSNASVGITPFGCAASWQASSSASPADSAATHTRR